MVFFVVKARWTLILDCLPCSLSGTVIAEYRNHDNICAGWHVNRPGEETPLVLYSHALIAFHGGTKSSRDVRMNRTVSGSRFNTSCRQGSNV
jgi:hypothetical protein